jgi:adenylylsulfate kinase-like enzyme
MALPVLLITGPVGVGKTSVAFEAMELLEERNVAHAFFDLDGLTYLYPKPANDRFGEQFALEALGLLCPRLREQGVAHLILARVLWEPESLTLYRRAIPVAEITVVRLTAPLDVLEERLRRREVGSAIDWYLARARECEERWSRDPVGNVLIQTAGRDVRTIAQEILDTLRWV